jgi:hypothetical protein
MIPFMGLLPFKCLNLRFSSTSIFKDCVNFPKWDCRYLVYPGANHTRFHHALGYAFNAKKQSMCCVSKGLISPEEENALYIAILLHDIGHGPFRTLWKKVLLCIMKKYRFYS